MISACDTLSPCYTVSAQQVLVYELNEMNERLLVSAWTVRSNTKQGFGQV